MNTKIENISKLDGNSRFIFILKRNILLIVLIILVIFSSLIFDKFLSLENVVSLIRTISIFGILSLGLLFCIISGNIDLSIGALVSVLSCMATKLVHYNYIYSITITIILGFVAGLLNGFIVGRLRANPIIATLGLMSIYQGLAFVVSKGYTMFGDPESPFAVIGKGSFLNIPVPVYIFLFISFILYILLNKNSIGKYIFATGCNENISRLFYINVGNIKMITYIIVGFCCAVSAIILASRMTGSYSYAGSFYLFDAITAVILGGASLNGGKGSIGNTIIGILIIGVLTNILLLLGISYASQQFYKGVVLVLAVIAYTFIEKRLRNE